MVEVGWPMSPRGLGHGMLLWGLMSQCSGLRIYLEVPTPDTLSWAGRSVATSSTWDQGPLPSGLYPVSITLGPPVPSVPKSSIRKICY